MAPNVTITAKPANPSSQQWANFTFSSTYPTATFECKLDSGDYTACTNPFGYINLVDGSHIFTVRGKDPAGNVDPTPATYSWMIASTVSLNANFAGTGKGSVLSKPPGIACNTNCSAKFDAGTQVILKATAEAFSLFNGWTNACTGTGDCTVIMSADRSVAATFNKDTAHFVRIDGAILTYYSSILGAYNSAAPGDVVKAWGTDFIENLLLNKNIAIIFKGGFNSGYTSNAGTTTLHGTITVGKGSLTVEHLVVQ